MKKSFIKIISTVLCLSCLMGLCSCAGSSEYKNDLTSEELASIIENALTEEGDYISASADFADFNMSGISEICVDFSIKLHSSDKNYTEFGVFKVKSNTRAKKAEQFCQGYIDTMKKYSMSDYEPKEYEKIQNGKVTVYGNYVVYTMVTPEDYDAINSAIIEAIKK